MMILRGDEYETKFLQKQPDVAVSEFDFIRAVDLDRYLPINVPALS